MHRKQTATARIPIFNAKRPKLALFAHPNNILSNDENRGHLKSPGHSAVAYSSFEVQANKSSSLKEVPFKSQLTTVPTIPLHTTRASSICPTNSVNDKFQQNIIQQKFQPLATSSKPLIQKQVYTPRQTVVKSEVDTPIVNSSTANKSKTWHTRVLTATAQGVQHWGKQSLYSHLLFEVFGVLDSQPTEGIFKAKQFLIKTNDGLLNCCFWEIDRSLVRLIRGSPYRVVGTWDQDNNYLKCVSVRQTRLNEDKWSRVAIKASDWKMRQLLSTQHEL